MEHGGSLADVVGKNPNVAQALALEKDELRRFSSYPRIQTWALFRRSESGEAHQVANQFKAHQLAQMADQMEFQFSPMSASATLEQYWTQRMLGHDKEAADLYTAAIERGIPLPSL